MRLYKYRPLDNFEFVLDILLNERLYCSAYEFLNDPLEGLFYTMTIPSGTTKKIRQYKHLEDLPEYESNLKICSLSKSLKDIRMWSHYAGGHTGVAIEIDFSGHKDEAVKINYHIGLQNHGTTLLTGASPEEVLSYKTEHWKYEEEYRVLRNDNYYQIPGRISAVYFGVKTTDFHKELLKKSAPKTINFFDTRLDRKNIMVKPI